MFYVYILKSKKDGDLYFGSTKDLRKRLSEHNNGEAHSAKWRRPFELVYYEAYKSGKDARMRERMLKFRRNAYSQLKRRIQDSIGAAVYKLAE